MSCLGSELYPELHRLKAAVMSLRSGRRKFRNVHSLSLEVELDETDDKIYWTASFSAKVPKAHRHRIIAGPPCNAPGLAVSELIEKMPVWLED